MLCKLSTINRSVKFLELFWQNINSIVHRGLYILSVGYESENCLFSCMCTCVHLDFSSQFKSKYWESGHADIILSNTTENDEEL